MPTQGYHEFAEIVGKYPGLAIFRRFATLNAQNLLYLQSELANLELELQTIVRQNVNSRDEKRQQYQTDITALKSAPRDADEGRQWRKCLEIREKLKEYSKIVRDCNLS